MLIVSMPIYHPLFEFFTLAHPFNTYSCLREGSPWRVLDGRLDGPIPQPFFTRSGSPRAATPYRPLQLGLRQEFLTGPARQIWATTAPVPNSVIHRCWLKCPVCPKSGDDWAIYEYAHQVEHLVLDHSPATRTKSR